VHRGQYLWTHPADVGEDVRQHGFPVVIALGLTGRQVFVAEHEEKQRLVVAHRES
jgi:hypothetical protein